MIWPITEEFSTDSKTLTIKSDADFPDVPAAISATAARDSSGTMKYTGTKNP